MPPNAGARNRIGSRFPGTLALWLFTSIVLITIPVQAQDPAADDEVYELSPFEVRGDETGYYATETLSGTYLRTEMRSLANPVTVMTQEFLADIGATDFEDAIEFLPSSQTYQGDVADNDGNQRRTQNSVNVRGFRVTQLTQNFFETRIRPDVFNTERITQSRGPNSVLFGLGSVGGSIDTSLKRGLFGTEVYDFELRVDDNESLRFMADVNTEIIEDKVAARLVYLHDDRRTFRDGQFRRRNSYFGNLTVKPFEKTTIHFFADVGDIDELNPRLFLPKNEISQFVNSPLTDLEKANLTDLDLVVNGPGAARTAARNLQNGITRGYPTNNALIWIENAPDLGVMNWKWKSRGDAPFINGRRVNIISVEDPQITPDEFYPIETIPSGPQDQYDTDYYKYGVDIQQQLFENTYLQFSYLYEDVENFDFRPVRRQEWTIKIDTNYYLPNQRSADNPTPDHPLNPYYGKPYFESNPFFQRNWTEYTQYRGNITHQFDFKGIEPFEGFDLGELTVLGSYYFFENKRWLTRQDEMTTVSVLPNGRLDNTQGRIFRRYYLNDPTPYWPDRPWQPIIQAADPTIPGNIKPEIISDFLNRLPPIHDISETESLTALGQWSLFRERLILTGGWRQDEITDSAMTFVRDPQTFIWEGFETGTMSEPDSNTVENTNWGVVVRPLGWLDLFMNGSTNNVNAGVTSFDIYSNSVPDQTGEGTDYGLRLFLFDNRVVLKVNYYENELQNQISNPLRDGDLIGIPMARENGRIEDFLDAMDYNGLSDLIEGTIHFDEYPGNGLWSDVQFTSSEGWEVEVTANITSNWRLLFNYSIQETSISDTYILLTPWYNEFIAPIRNDANITSLPADPEDDPNETIGDIFNDIDRKILFHRSQVGGQQIRSHQNSWNLVTTYQFTDEIASWLDGYRLGLATRWREAPSLGYPETPDGNFDVQNPFYGLEEWTTDMFVSKTFRVGGRGRGNSGRLGVTFRVYNVANDQGWVPRTAVSDENGNPVWGQQVFQTPRYYQLTLEYSF